MVQADAPASLCFGFADDGRCTIDPDAEQNFMAFAGANEANLQIAVSFLDDVRKEALRLSEQIEANAVFE